MGKITAAITGVGEYLPDYILTNEELSTMVDTSDEWIMSHIGVKTRHILKGEGVGSSYMGARAVINLLDKAGVDPMEIDLVICATVTPDMFFPSTGNLIADQADARTPLHTTFRRRAAASFSPLRRVRNSSSRVRARRSWSSAPTRCRRSWTTPTVPPVRSSATAPPPYCWNPMKRDTAFWTRFSVRTVRASCSST